MRLKRETLVDAPPEAVWQVLGPQYAEAYKWASSINISTGRGSPTAEHRIKGAPTNGRVCETDLGPFKEDIELYDEDARELAYSARGEKMPFFVKRLLNHWKVESDGSGGSRVIMELNVRLMFPFSILMALPMRLQLGGVLKNAHEELKHYVEHGGEPHPRKVEATKKLTAVASAA